MAASRRERGVRGNLEKGKAGKQGNHEEKLRRGTSQLDCTCSLKIAHSRGGSLIPTRLMIGLANFNPTLYPCTLTD